MPRISESAFHRLSRIATGELGGVTRYDPPLRRRGYLGDGASLSPAFLERLTSTNAAFTLAVEFLRQAHPSSLVTPSQIIADNAVVARRLGDVYVSDETPLITENVMEILRTLKANYVRALTLSRRPQLSLSWYTMRAHARSLINETIVQALQADGFTVPVSLISSNPVSVEEFMLNASRYGVTA